MTDWEFEYWKFQQNPPPHQCVSTAVCGGSPIFSGDYTEDGIPIYHKQQEYCICNICGRRYDFKGKQ